MLLCVWWGGGCGGGQSGAETVRLSVAGKASSCSWTTWITAPPSPHPGPGRGDSACRMLRTSELRVTCHIVTRRHRELVQSTQGLGNEIFHYPVRAGLFL